MVKGTIFDVKKFSIHDGPGIRTTVFFKGCPLSCRWCHNPEGQAPGPELILRPARCIGCEMCLEVCERDAILSDGGRIVTDRARCAACGACVEVCYAGARELVGREVTAAQVMDEIGRDVAFYDESGGGVTFSGGEPLAQPTFLSALLKACRRIGIHTTLDTCGFAPWEALDVVRGDVDLFFYDLKLMDDARHRRATGFSNARILRNLERLSRHNHRIVLRVPIIPGISADEENVRAMGAFAAGLPSLERIDLLPYHRIGRDKYRRLGRVCPMPEVDPPSEERMDALARLLKAFGLRTNLDRASVEESRSEGRTRAAELPKAIS